MSAQRNDERMKILSMLDEGKITVQDAERLLRAVGEARGGAAQGTRAEAPAGAAGGHRGHGGAERADLGDLIDAVTAEVRRTLDAVQTSQIGRTVRQEVERAVGRLRQGDVGALIEEVVEQVRDAVGERMGRTPRVVEEEEKEWRFDAAELGQVQASVVSGYIEIAGEDTEEVTVFARKRVRGPDREVVQAFAADMRLLAAVDGDRLTLTQEPPKAPRGVEAEVRYRIVCPQRLGAELRLVNGNLVCERLGGGVSVQTTNGNATLRECAGATRASVRNGNVHAALEELSEEAVLETVNGNVTLEIRRGGGRVEGTSRNGNVDLTLAVTQSGVIEARTTHGVVSCDLPLSKVAEQTRTVLVGTLGEEGAAEIRVHLETRNGNVRIRGVEPAGAADSPGPP